MKVATLILIKSNLPLNEKGRAIKELALILENRGYHVLYVVMDVDEVEVARQLSHADLRKISIILKEGVGSGEAGGLVSLAPLIKRNYRVLLTMRAYITPKLLDAADSLYSRFKYNLLLTHDRNSSKLLSGKVSASGRVIGFPLTEEVSSLIARSLFLLKGSLFKWFGKRVYNRPALIDSSLIEALNDYLFHRGRLYVQYVEG